MSLAATALAAATAAAVSPASYDLDLRYDAATATLSGTERIAVVNRGDRATSTFWLRTWANGRRGCRTSGVRIRVLAPARADARAVACTALRVRLARPLAPGRRTSVRLAVRVRAPSFAGRIGRYRGAAYFGNALPVVAVAGAPLSPWAGDNAEPFHSEAARWRARVRLPRGLRIAMTGSGPEGRSTAFAREFALAIGRFDPIETRVGGVRLRFWRLRGTEPRYARRALRNSAGAMRLFARWGAYPGRELDLVDWSGGMEYPEIVFTQTADIYALHEVAHQWFFGLVGNDQYAHPWLDESLSQYATERAMLAVERPGQPRPEGHARCAEPVRGEAGRSMAHWRGRSGYGDAVYIRGACAFTRLELAMGVEKMDAALRAYVRANRFGIATREALRAALAAQSPPPDALAAWARAFGLAP